MPEGNLRTSESDLEERGHIDPKEPLVLQEYRSVIRANQFAYSTEEAYVAQVRKFLRAVKRLDAFERVGAEDGYGLSDLTARDVESHPTNLAVSVAASAA
ncbi:hypothetical protein [Stieleria varia]|uniref:Integrase SAM-like N-terminal domain-containing protein n=1 Tax=Stieleria varia TaxID=2528005 RepID=A0A5C6B7G7_9BACT|nr:hypothetical protein [Stieleria varia]TWT92118.1 hypothetical protein Pla52n_64150 [Stieleria varia]TWU07747.1 hypothetical protein Pla52n_03200 [Stieleria varia]